MLSVAVQVLCLVKGNFQSVVVMARPQVADEGTVFDMEGSCE